MDEIYQRISFLEETVEVLRTQNLVLATAFRSLIQGLPAKAAADVVEAIRMGFDDELARLEYEDSRQSDVFHDAVHAFFGERR